MARLFSGDGKPALARAIVAFESATAAGLVLAVRPRSASDLHVNVLVGAAFALAAMLFLRHGEPEFDLHWSSLCPALLGLSWDASCDPVRSAVRRGATALAEVCGRHLPRAPDDVNELPDEVMS